MMTDPIADMLTRIRNASMARKKEVSLPYSKIKLLIANILVREGYLAKAEMVKEAKPMIAITLKYNGRAGVIQHLKRISTPGHRCYVKKGDIKQVLNGLGFSILSTPRGILSNKEARQANVGGELICEIY